MTKSKIKSSGCAVDSEVIRKIRQHARSHMKSEVCGVLIGDVRKETIYVDECIPGINASQAGSHVTFTQDTWEHVYKIKDKEFPEARIIGWYHSHPGFGVFLSEHDTFIHKNFFSSPDQIAWVYDPHSDEEGCFGWVDDRIERIASIKIVDQRGGEPAHSARQHQTVLLDTGEDQEDGILEDRAERGISNPWARWTITVLTHALALLIGVLVAWYVFPRLLVVGVPIDPQTGRPMMGSTPENPGSKGASIKNDLGQDKLNQQPPVPKSDGAKGSDVPAR
jgi:proteasome lid subunit RPN8/RPN11